MSRVAATASLKQIHFQVKQQNIFDPIPFKKLQSLSKDELIEFHEAHQKVIEDILKDNQRLRDEAAKAKQHTLFVNDQYILLKRQIFGKSSEKEPSTEPSSDGDLNQDEAKTKKTKVQLPSLRYPNAPVIVEDIEFKDMPPCSCCGTMMSDSGMTEDSEYLTVQPRKFVVVKQRRHKYCCTSCHGDIKTAPQLPRITPGSSYSDELMIDVATSKFCDLVPIERYATIAGREGLSDLPQQSLIELTHNLAEFVEPAVERILEVEIKTSELLHADETPHRMLEGSAKSNWFLWGFSTPSASFFEIHDTRSGDVASDILKNSKALYLMSDVFSGYGKAVKDTNQFRIENNQHPIKSIYCNAHARRKFKEARDRFKEGQVYLDLFKKIYFLESLGKGKAPDELLNIRLKMRPLFEEIRARAMEDLNNYSSKSSMAKACTYFLKNYVGFTLFLENPKLPIDNNPQERLLRNPVIGRKTWYGTHSERGAKTTAIMFTLIESCKLNHINPREYLKNLVFELHQGKKAFTPNEFKQLKDLAHRSTG